MGKVYVVEVFIVRNGVGFYDLLWDKGVVRDLKLLSFEMVDILGEGKDYGGLLVIMQLEKNVCRPLVNYLFLKS